MSIFNKIFRPKNSTNGSAFPFFFGTSASGKRVNERSSLQISAVYACVRILSETIGTLPFHLYRVTPDGGREKAIDHPLYFLLAKEPNSEMTSTVFRQTMMLQALLWGNAYAQIIRNGRGEVLEIYPLQASRMKVDRDENCRLYYEYTRSDGDANSLKGTASTVKLKPEEVLHIPSLGFDGIIGSSTIALAKNSIGLAIATEEYASKLFQNGARPSGVLEHPGVLKDSEKLRKSWQETFGGSGNSNKVAVLEEGVHYQPISISPEEAQFLDSRKFSVQEIARVFRIPPHMLGDLERSTYNNVEEMSLEFVKYTLEPWIILWEQCFERSLLTRDEKMKYFIKMNVDGLLRGDFRTRMEGYRVGINCGIYSVNEVRRLEDLDILPEARGGEFHVTNGNVVKLEDAGLAYSVNGNKVTEKEGDDEGDTNKDDKEKA